MKRKYTLSRVSGRDITFTGELVAESISTDFPGFRKSQDRWTELRLYKTVGGNFICESVGKSRLPNEVDLSKIKVAESEVEVIEFFRESYLSRDLYEQAGIRLEAEGVD
tara:strand:- start:796 stop:1122 length:327 start_codon:yes stop_codon:yes gene_type:complete